MKKFIIQAVALIVVILIGVYVSANPKNLDNLLLYLNPYLASQPAKSQQPVSQGNLKVGNALINVDVANTQEKRVKGLSGIDSIPKNYGLLFVLEKVDTHKFWMKGVKFPLDFIWIRGDTVVDITPNVQPPTSDQSDNLLPVYQSKEPVDKVLEVSAGAVLANNIKVGDKVAPQ